MRVLVAGASGLIGGHVVTALVANGHEVVALSRDHRRHGFPSGVRVQEWDGNSPLRVAGDVEAVLNFAGEPILGKRWTKRHGEVVRASRVDLTRRLADFIAAQPSKKRPKVFVCASAVGYYGIWPKGVLKEDAPRGDDILAKLCADWERAAMEASCRVVCLRIGLVLSPRGGYLGRILPFARLGLGGRIGSGRQPLPWVHIDDVVAAVLWAIKGKNGGAYNVVAPQPRTQADLVRALNRVMLIPSFVPIPTLALRVRFGAIAPILAGGQDARSDRLIAAGFKFRHVDLQEAVTGLVRRP